MERKTRQREAIRAVLDDAHRPLTPQEVLKEARLRVPSIGIATIYRTLSAFEQEGLASPVQLPGDPMRYEPVGKKHHHFFRCRRCAHVYEVEGCLGDGSSITPDGFKLEGHELLLYGICSECR